MLNSIVRDHSWTTGLKLRNVATCVRFPAEPVKNMLFPCVDGGMKDLTILRIRAPIQMVLQQINREKKCHKKEVPEKGNIREISPEAN